MTDILKGVRVLEVAFWTFVPSAGAILSDWGADVIKIEHPETGDPQRGLATMGVMPGGMGAVNFMIEFPNRGKRSVGININTDEGRELIYKLAKTADVFLTSFLPDARERMKIDVEDIRAQNPNIIYVRGHGQGSKGPDAGKGGYDGASFWSRGGVGDTLRSPLSPEPAGMRPAIGDVMGGLAIAGGIAAALYHREKTGEAKLVDISLLGTAMWQLQPDIVMTGVMHMDDVFRMTPGGSAPNPLVGNYRTQDDRYVFLNMMQADKFWVDFCTHLGRTDLLEDPRFTDSKFRLENKDECIAEIAATFASAPLKEWRTRLETMEGVWAPVQRVPELYDDVQVLANGYLRDVTDSAGNEFKLVGAPVQFDEQPHDIKRAPDHGEHTDSVLEELGLTWDEIMALKVSGAIL